MSVALAEQLRPDALLTEAQATARFQEITATVAATAVIGATGERAAIPIHERSLTEVDNLNRLRRPDGTHDPAVLEDVRANLVPRVKEPAMPYAVSRTRQERRGGSYWWLDQTGPQVAASGRLFHKHQAALDRVGVEELEAADVEWTLRPGRTKVLFSPRMSEKDASREVAVREHLADDDMVRIHRTDVGEDGEIEGKFMESALVRDVPLSAWARLLADPDSILGKAVVVDDPESALSVMKSCVGLEVPDEVLPEGVVTLIEAVTSYIDDPAVRQKVMDHVQEFRANQQTMHEVALATASDWLNFEVSLADSLHAEFAEPEVEKFIEDLHDQWTDEDLAMFAKHRLADGRLYMTRKLAVRLEDAKQNVLWAEAAVAVNNQRVIKQMNTTTVERIRANHATIQELQATGGDPRRIAELKTENSQLAAAENVTVGGGCPGESSGNFKKDKKDDKPAKEESKDDTKEKGSKKGKREWMYCVNCPLCKKDDVNAYIDYMPAKSIKRITCCSCKGHKDYSL